MADSDDPTDVGRDIVESRREVLRTGALGMLAALAGCTGGATSGSGGPNGNSGTPGSGETTEGNESTPTTETDTASGRGDGRRQSFTDGPAEWSSRPPSIPDEAWPMMDRTPDGSNSTPAPGPTDFPLERSWTVSVTGVEDRPLPVVRDETVFLSLGKKGLLAVDVADGTEQWRHAPEDPIYSPTIAASDESLFTKYDQYRGSDEFGVTAYRADGGSKQWNTRTETEVSGDVLLTESSVVSTDFPARVFALDRASGERAWSFTLRSPNDQVRGVAITDKVYLATAGSTTDYPNLGFVHALDPGAGELAWSVEFDRPVQGTAATQETVLAINEDAITALATDTGSERWRHSVDPHLSRLSSIALGDDLAIVGLDEKLLAYEIATGKRRWEVWAPPYSQVAIANDVVYTASARPEGAGMTAHELQSGERLWSGPDGMMSPPVVANGRLVVGTDRGEVVAWA